MYDLHTKFKGTNRYNYHMKTTVSSLNNMIHVFLYQNQLSILFILYIWLIKCVGWLFMQFFLILFTFIHIIFFLLPLL